MSDASEYGNGYGSKPRSRCDCAMRCDRRGSRLLIALALSSICATRKWRGSRFLNEALDPLFAQVPDQVDLFDRGISQGDTPRLWIDVVAHILMGRDKRMYRFVQDIDMAGSCSRNPMTWPRSSMPPRTMSRAG